MSHRYVVLLSLLLLLWRPGAVAWAQTGGAPGAGPGPAGQPAPVPAATPAPVVAPAAPAAPRAEPGPPSSRRCRWVRLALGQDTTYFRLADTLTVVPASVQGPGGRPVAYNPRTGRYRWVRPAPRAPLPTADLDSSSARLPVADSLLVCYRVLPLALERFRGRRSQRIIDSLGFRQLRPFTAQDFTQREQLISTPGINKSGNLSRGVSFGNAQNVFVNSALNLQLEGMLTESIRLTAAISDQNVPFQPEGNTQTLQQFDRIFITLAAPQWSLTAGDVVLRNKPDYFLRYYKNIQGAAAELNLGGGAAAPGGAVGPGAVLGLPGAVGLAPNAVPGLPGAPGLPGSLTPSPSPGERGTSPGSSSSPNVGPGLSSGSPSPPERGSGGEANAVNTLRSSTLVAGGVAKGKFASIELTAIDNVQGPYRLRGPNGEQFIIVLAGSERVYVDGRLVGRGFDNDYVIDYNLAEITFSPRRVITVNTRLRVDFEYSDLNYARSLLTASHYQQLGRRGQVHGNFYQEADNPDNLANLTLTGLDRQRLRGAGNVASVATPGADSAAFNRGLVQYHRVRQTLPGGGSQWVFVLARDSLRGVYNVRFTDVGPGQGDYNQSTTEVNANGRVYVFVGAGQGRYRAQRVLPTPSLRQMLTAGATWQLDPTAAVFVDVASSTLQRNRFDTTGTRSQTGGAVRVGYAVQDRALPAWVPAGLRAYRLRSAFDFEHAAAGFAPVDRYRDIEFDRNWSAASTANATQATQRQDNIANFSLGLTRDAARFVNYRLSRRLRPGEVNGLQHWLDLGQRWGRLELRGSFFLLNSQAGRFTSTWGRGEATARYGGGRWFNPGYTYRFDKNRVVSPRGDTVRSVNYFDEHLLFVQSADSGRTRYSLSYAYRRDQTPTPEQRALTLNNVAQTWQGNLVSRLGRSQDLRLVGTFRDVRRVGQADSSRLRNLLGQLDYNAGLLDNQVRSELSYSIQTGREPRRDFSFVAVPAGQGNYYYAGDLNGNGVQDKDEFLEAQTPDAQFRTFIKVFLPTTDYLTAYQSRLNYRLTVGAPRGWRDVPGLRAALARLSSVTSLTVDRRTTSPDLGARLSPFSLRIGDPQLLAFNQLIRQTFFFNRANPNFGAELTWQQTQQKTLLTEGFDLRNLTTRSLLLRRTLAQSFAGRLLGSYDVREAQASYSQLSTSPSYRNYRIQILAVQPEISYQPRPALRLTGTLSQSRRVNVWPERAQDAAASFTDLGLELRLSQVGRRTLTASTHATRVTFEGQEPAASVVGLEILQALRPGANYTWNVNLEQRLTSGLNLNVVYDGRKASGLDVIHTGRMQVAALF